MILTTTTPDEIEDSITIDSIIDAANKLRSVKALGSVLGDNEIVCHVCGRRVVEHIGIGLEVCQCIAEAIRDNCDEVQSTDVTPPWGVRFWVKRGVK